ncbi:rod shape-determining protein MreC [Planctomycetota bacterium]
MAKERSSKTGISILIGLILLTLLLAPLGVFSLLRIYALSFVSSAMEKMGFYEGHTTELTQLKTDKARLTSLLKQKEAEIYGLNNSLKQFSEVKELSATKNASVIWAKVIFYDPSSAKSRITLDKGAEHGVKKGAVVLSGAFLLGKIINVSAASSKVLLINDPSASFSVYVSNKRLSGILKGQGKGHGLIVKFIDNQPENSVSKGDIVETSGFAEGIPPHVMIGEICNDPEKDTAQYHDFIRIKVKPYVNILTLKHACVLVYSSLDTEGETSR